MSLQATLRTIEAQQKRAGIAGPDEEHQQVLSICVITIPSGRFIDQDRIDKARWDAAAGIGFRLPCVDGLLMLMDAPEMPAEYRNMAPPVEDAPRSEPNPASPATPATMGMSAADKASIAQIEAAQRAAQAARGDPGNLKAAATALIAKARSSKAYDPNDPLRLTR